MAHSRTHANKRGFMLAEVIASAILVGLLISLFFASVNALDQAEAHTSHRTCALRVLDNTLERLRVLPMRTVPDVQQTLDAEFRAAEFAWPKGTVAYSREDDAGLEMVVRQESGPTWASVILPWTTEPSPQK